MIFLKYIGAALLSLLGIGIGLTMVFVIACLLVIGYRAIKEEIRKK